MPLDKWMVFGVLLSVLTAVTASFHLGDSNEPAIRIDWRVLELGLYIRREQGTFVHVYNLILLQATKRTKLWSGLKFFLADDNIILLQFDNENKWKWYIYSPNPPHSSSSNNPDNITDTRGHFCYFPCWAFNPETSFLTPAPVRSEGFIIVVSLYCIAKVLRNCHPKIRISVQTELWKCKKCFWMSKFLTISITFCTINRQITL